MPRSGFDPNMTPPDPLWDRVKKFLSENAPGAVKAASGAAQALLGPENPPVNAALTVMQRGDPMNAMGLGMATGPIKGAAGAASKAAKAGKAAPIPKASVRARPEGWTMGVDHAEMAVSKASMSEKMRAAAQRSADAGDAKAAEYAARRAKVYESEAAEHAAAAKDPVAAAAYDDRWWKQVQKEDAAIGYGESH